MLTQAPLETRMALKAQNHLQVRKKRKKNKVQSWQMGQNKLGAIVVASGVVIKFQHNYTSMVIELESPPTNILVRRNRSGK